MDTFFVDQIINQEERRMEMKKVAVALTHGHVAKWSQTSIYSIKSKKNENPFDIYVANSWPGHCSLKAITGTELGDGVTIIDCVRRKHSHAVGLDEILDLVHDKYEYLFTMETDCMAMKDGWLDWFLSFMRPEVGIAGFYWDEGRNHQNINASGTMYRMKMLWDYQQEVRANKDRVLYHPSGDKSCDEPGQDSSIPDTVGVFSETRGIKNPTPEQRQYIERGVPQAAWFEPGQWLYCRLQGEWQETRVPVEHIYIQACGHTLPEGTYYGTKADPYFIHWWGGTRAWDHLKHPVNDNFVKSCSPFWLDREHKLWESTVPKKYRGIVADIYKELHIEGMGYDK